MPGQWAAARLNNAGYGDDSRCLCGAAFWHVGEVGATSEAVAEQLREVARLGGDYGENVENEAVREAGWRFVGRYSWQYYGAELAKRESAKLGSGHEDAPYIYSCKTCETADEINPVKR